MNLRLFLNGVLLMQKNKYHLSKEQNKRLAKINLTRLVFVNSRFEGLTTTLPQTQTIIDGLGVDGVSIDDINIIVQLKRGWQYTINYEGNLDLDFLKQVNKIVALNESLDPGNLRTGNGAVSTMKGEFTPPVVNQGQEIEFLNRLLSDHMKTATDQALTLMYHLMRNQIFWDGNKRTASLAANKIMINNGAGLINVPLDQWPKWNQLIAEFYFSGDMRPLKKWTYDHGIQGVKL